MTRIFARLEQAEIAAELITSLNDGAVLWQVACEYLWASRKLETLGYSHSEAVEDIRYLRRAALDRIDALRDNYSLSFWDALLIATCLEGRSGAVVFGRLQFLSVG